MLLKVPWFTPGFSYCRWWGVECCLTASEGALPSCSGGLQSIGALALAGQLHTCCYRQSCASHLRSLLCTLYKAPLTQAGVDQHVWLYVQILLTLNTLPSAYAAVSSQQQPMLQALLYSHGLVLLSILLLHTLRCGNVCSVTPMHGWVPSKLSVQT